MITPKKGCYIRAINVNTGEMVYDGYKKPGQILSFNGDIDVLIFNTKKEYEGKNYECNS